MVSCQGAGICHSTSLNQSTLVCRVVVMGRVRRRGRDIFSECMMKLLLAVIVVVGTTYRYRSLCQHMTILRRRRGGFCWPWLDAELQKWRDAFLPAQALGTNNAVEAVMSGSYERILYRMQQPHARISIVVEACTDCNRMVMSTLAFLASSCHHRSTRAYR